MVTVVDAFAAEQVETRRDVRWRSVFGGMTREVQPGLAREAEALEELLGRIGCLGRVHTEADQLVAPVRDHFLGHLQSHRRRILPVDVGNQAAADAEVVLGGEATVDQPVDDRRHRDVAGRVQRRVEEHLPVLQVAQLHAVLERLVRDPREVLVIDHR